jgi:hypothetical protein
MLCFQNFFVDGGVVTQFLIGVATRRAGTLDTTRKIMYRTDVRQLE